VRCLRKEGSAATLTGSAMRGPRLVSSLSRLRQEVDRLWPERDRSSDGWIGDQLHQQRQSDHNPDRRGRVHALDLDVGGIDPVAVVRVACLHPSTAYVIWDHQIYSRRVSFIPKTYSGSDPHQTHIHVSVLHSIAGRRSRRSWLGLGRWPVPK
jgi:hypothetical protein